MTVAVIRTKRLRFRPYTLADADALYEVFSDAEARTFYPEMADPDSVRGWIEWNLRNYDQFGFGLWALELQDSGDFIGDCGLTYQEVEGVHELEIGYHVIRSQRRNGYATEAARACVDYGFTHTSCVSICSIVDPSNTASHAVASRVHTTCREFTKKGKRRLLFFTPRTAWLGSS